MTMLTRRLINITFACVSVITTLAQTDVSLADVSSIALPMVSITTVDGEEPAAEHITHPDDPQNVNITYSNQPPCQIVITMLGDTLYDSGPYVESTSGATIRINGNTSAYYSNALNMPYKLKLERKADLLIRGDDNRYSDRNWRLLKDATTMNTITGLKLSRLIGMQWTAGYTPCNLVINGDYRGCYLLIETVRRNPKCRIDCDKNTGYIVERDPYWWKEDRWFTSEWYSGESRYRWTWKYPDEDDITPQRESYIQTWINDLEQCLADSADYTQYVDVSSFARWLLAHDLLGTYDSGGANMYFKKHDNTDNTRLEMPCLWDFDSNYVRKAEYFSTLHTSTTAYFRRMLESPYRDFAREYVTLWNNIKDSLTAELTAFVDNYPDTDEGKALSQSRTLHNKRWNTKYGSVRQDAQKTLQWFEKHIPLIDPQIQRINTGSTEAITSAYHHSLSGAETVYDLQGRRVRQSNLHSAKLIKRNTSPRRDGTHSSIAIW